MFSFCPILAVLLTNCADVTSRIIAQRCGDTFDLTGQVLVDDNGGDPILHLSDATGGAKVMGVRHVVMPLPFKPGDTIRATGIINVPRDSRSGRLSTICKSVQLIAEGKPPPPIRVDARIVASGKYSAKSVVVRGKIRRIVHDEVSIGWVYISLSTPDGIIYLTTKCSPSQKAEIHRLIDAEVDATGICASSANMFRRLFGYHVGVPWPQGFSIITPPPADPYSVPLLDAMNSLSMSTINRFGRHRVVGTVTAVCSDRRIVIHTDNGAIHDIHLLGDQVPSLGTRIETVGIPEADYCQINLVDAIWRKTPGTPRTTEKPRDVTIEQLLTDGKGRAQINPSFHGKAIRTIGTLIDMPTRESERDFAILKDTGGTILLDIASTRQALDNVSVGCKIGVSGVCTVNRESSSPQQRFQRVNGITLVVRTPDDVTVLSRPPWWTPERLLMVVAVLLLAILAFFIWNRLLQRVVERKGRQLMREHIARIKTSLRIDERTHLAVELHDSLSQNLSGVACQIAATKGSLPAHADNAARYLSTAERMLLSCRTELRRCLWDLRENALEEKYFDEAIRKTLAPVVEGTRLSIRFDVPRIRLDDTIAHAILCIIRELVSNAVHHGKARNIHICGESQNDMVSFSVYDDGCGFDPHGVAGAAEGHFGIEGIRERIKRLNGTFDISSDAGKGCKVTASIPIE